MPQVTFSAKDEPLRNDVNALGALLGEVLREQCGEALYERVEAARAAARRRRDDDPEGERELRRALQGLTPAEATELVRAFSTYFGLVNLAERIHRIRRRRAYKASGEAQPGALDGVVQALARRGVEAERLGAMLAELCVEPVFTAHPTESTRRTLLHKEQRIAEALITHALPRGLRAADDDDLLEDIREEVTTTWQTEELPAARPTVADEVEHVVFYLTEVVYRAIPRLRHDAQHALRAAYGARAPAVPRALVRFGSWVGGDMDGNPNVGADTVRATLSRHRQLIVQRYRDDVRDLFGHLSQSCSRVGVSRALNDRLAHYRAAMPETARGIPPRYGDMPYRELLFFVGARLRATQSDGEQRYDEPRAFLADLELIEDSLRANAGQHAGLGRVEDLAMRLATFGFHLAALDLRQDALVHRRVAGRLLGDSEFTERSAEERVARLAEALVATPSSHAVDDAEVRATLEVFAAVKTSRERFGPEAIGRYIISMAQGADDVLAVLFLARAAGLATSDGAVPLDVVPLFETVPDLDAAPRTLARILEHPLYRAHLERRGLQQEVMLGYSDSSKESGLAASRWALHRVQADVVALCDAHGVRLTLFHGRGGTASRGGSKPRAAILAEPPGVVRGRMRVTEQGEIIHAKYGIDDIAVRTLELMSGAVLEVSLAPPAGAPPARWSTAMDAVARLSREAYQALTGAPDFWPYFRAATPIDVIERLRIGSRPASRRSGEGLGNLRAIPWVFAWTQNRQLVPGWFGVGAGLAHAAAEHGIDELRAMARGWPFFANLLGDTEMVLAKADMGIGDAYAELAGAAGRRVHRAILDEFERTRRMICEILRTSELLEHEPVLARSILLRNPYVDPMSLLQVDLLRRWRAGERRDEALEHALAITVHGISRGMQNTG